MNRFVDWLNRWLSNCLGRRCSGHAPLKENFDLDIDAKQMILLERIVPMQPITQSATIFHLTDDCLLEIFSYLSLYDLAAVSATCSRLQNLADYEFLRNNQPFAISDDVVFGYDEVCDEERLPRALEILKAFGRLIDTFEVHGFIYYRMLPLLHAQMLRS